MGFIQLVTVSVSARRPVALLPFIADLDDLLARNAVFRGNQLSRMLKRLICQRCKRSWRSGNFHRLSYHLFDEGRV